MPTIRLATDEDLRAITSQSSEAILQLPHLYIAAEEPGMMRAWGVARADGEASVAWYAANHPDALVAPRYAGERMARAELLYYGAEPAADFA